MFRVEVICAQCSEPLGTVEADIGRPPPPCSNPDSPAYADCGDPGCWEWCDDVHHEPRCGQCDHLWTDEEVWDQIEKEADRLADDYAAERGEWRSDR